MDFKPYSKIELNHTIPLLPREWDVFLPLGKIITGGQ